MKKIFTRLALVALMVVPIACDFSGALEEEAFDFITTEDFYQTPADANAAVMGVYGAVRDRGMYGRDAATFLVTTAGVFEGKSVTGLPETKLTFDARYGRGEDMWISHYEGINRANAVLKYVPDIEMTANQKNRLLAETRLLRAFMYFDLVRWFGGVPIRTEPTEEISTTYEARATPEEVYALVVEDLKFAEQHLPAKGIGDPGRVNAPAAKALLAKVYLTMAGEPLGDDSKLTAAREKLLELVDPANCAVGKLGHALEPDYADLFWRVSKPRVVTEPAIENGPESVFEINFSQRSDVTGSIFPNVQTAGRGQSITDWLKGKFEEGDYRLERTANPKKKFEQLKMPMTGSINNNHENNWIVIRWPDVMLMYAEVENELSGPNQQALNCVNAVRARARNADGTPRNTPKDLTLDEVGSKAEFSDLIFNERVRELALEGHIWMDAQRTGRIRQIVEEQGRTYDPRIELWAIPQNQIDLTKGVLTQNPGY